MASQDDEDDDIPLLEDIVRPGRQEGRKEGGQTTLTQAEIEAIAARVVERHTKRLESAVARAIQTAIDLKERQQRGQGPKR